MGKQTLTLEMNRVEGDLTVKLEVEDNVITDAWCVGTMFRGFEQILQGRAAKDGLVITPRICGICGTAHQHAAVTALESAYNCDIAPNGTRVRNICLMAEEVQSDPRHAFLMFTIDMCHERYKDLPGYQQTLAAFEPFKGRFYKETIHHTKRILEIVAIFGGQWPHSSYMVPGGVTGTASRRSIVKSLTILDEYIKWYENSVLGCSLDRWEEIKTRADLEAWLDQNESHNQSGVGHFLKFAKTLGLEKLGKATSCLLSAGVYFDPEKWQPPFNQRHCWRTPGFYDPKKGKIEPFSHQEVTEHVLHSWYANYEGGKHPWEGQTVPDFDPTNITKYSWAKAPRYQDQVVEVGPFVELFMQGDKLIQNLYNELGSNVWLRQFARFHRPVSSLKQMRKYLTDLDVNYDRPFYIPPKELPDCQGHGVLHAARGFIGHWIKVKDHKIEKYQVITPTGWNASPRDSKERRGHWEQTFIGTKVSNLDDPIEIGHIVRSHDACLVCTVHMLDTGKKITYGL